MINKNKCKRHKWDIGDESCFNCGYYTEYCTKCGAIRLLNPSGKQIDTYEQ